MAKNANLHKAKSGKNDEFYTQFNDIQNELKHYKEHFKNKIVLCNCDDPKQSNFFRYFVNNFHQLKLKKLITTCYKNSKGENFSALEQALPLYEDKNNGGGEQQDNEKSCYLVYEGKDKNSKILEVGQNIDDFVNNLGPVELLSDKEYAKMHKITTTSYYPAGDFRSKECIELLKQADIVVTNPPFSLFREYVAQLIEYDKKFLIIGNKNALTYKEIFKLIKDNQIWCGYTPMSKDLLFDTSETFKNEILENKNLGSGYKIIDGKIKARAQAIWFTNLPHKKRNEILETIYNYDPQKYPKYDNYDAINVDKTLEIPMDYDGVMGVPITFLDKYNPSQFEILGMDDHRYEYPNWRGRGPDLNGKPIYRRIIIKNKNPKKS